MTRKEFYDSHGYALTAEDLMINEFTQADCDGGQTYYVVCVGADMSDRGQVSDWFETEKEAEKFIANFDK